MRNQQGTDRALTGVHYIRRLKKDEKAQEGIKMIKKNIASMNFITDRSEWTETLIPEPFRTLDISGYPELHPDREQVIEAADAYCKDLFAGIYRPAIFYGPPGTGKTELASAIWNTVAPAVPDRANYGDALRCGTAENIAFVRGEEIPTIIKSGKDENTGKDMRAHIESCFFCVLDDLDKCPAGGWSERLLGITNTRIWKSNLPTVITMNATPLEFARRYGISGESILSRWERSGGLFVRLDK